MKTEETNPQPDEQDDDEDPYNDPDYTGDAPGGDVKGG